MKDQQLETYHLQQEVTFPQIVQQEQMFLIQKSTRQILEQRRQAILEKPKTQEENNNIRDPFNFTIKVLIVCKLYNCLRGE